MTNFEDFGLSQALNASIKRMDYTTPTPIQEKAIPIALEGRDILGSAQTGTGKTAAFSIPMVEALLRNPNATALILTPTRELAKQVLTVVHQLLGRESNINTAFIIGGEHMGKQFTQLRANPRIIVGTPGRINDHLERRSLDLSKASFLVLDETDRMLDMGFGVQLDRIVEYLPKERQTLMFSATLPQGIVKLSSKYLNNPERVSVGETNVVAINIKQEALRVEQPEKYDALISQLHERTGSVIVFVKTKYNADRMATKLRKDGFTADGLHGDLRQNKRDKVMSNFRQQNFRILVATDIAARGLDVPHIEHVINYDLPQVAEDYIHRMGRTARAGAEGSAISFVASQDARKWHAIERLLNPDMAANDMPEREGRNKSRRKPYRGRPEKGEKPSFARKPRPEGRSDNRPNNRSDRPEKRDDARGDKPSFAARPNKRNDSRGDKPAYSGKPHAQSDSRSDNRGNKRPDTRSDNRPDNRGNKRPDTREDNRPDNRGNTRPDNRGEKRTYAERPNKPEGASHDGGNKFVTNRTKKKSHTGPKKHGGFKSDGSAPMKRRSNSNPNHKKSA